MQKYKMYVVWYTTKSGKYTREISFYSYNKALSLYNNIDTEFKYLIGIDFQGVHHTIKHVNANLK